MTMEAQALSLPPPQPIDTASSSLLLDFDGTLVPLTDDPASVVVERDLTNLIGRLADCLDGRVAIVSGRSIAQLDTLLGPVARLLSLSGSHGCEHRWDGIDAHPIRPLALDSIADRFEAFAASHPGMLIEIKSFGVALHYRRAPELEGAANALAQELAAEAELAYQPGSMVAEIRVPGSDKGVAVTRLMGRPPMAGTTPIFIGDDDTDEAGFAAAIDLGGTAIAVGPRPSTHARNFLADPAAVRGWLEELTL